MSKITVEYLYKGVAPWPEENGWYIVDDGPAWQNRVIIKGPYAMKWDADQEYRQMCGKAPNRTNLYDDGYGFDYADEWDGSEWTNAMAGRINKQVSQPAAPQVQVQNATVEQVEKEVVVTLPDGNTAKLRGDGKLWVERTAFGSKVVVPIESKELYMALTGDGKPMDITAVCSELPAEEWRLPVELAQKWGRLLATKSTEAMLVYGRHRTDKAKWIAVVPKQKATSAEVEVLDFMPAWEMMTTLGYKRVGSIHTHPGGMTAFSKTDETEMWKDFGGVHLIQAKSGKWGVYLVNSGIVFSIGELLQYPDSWSGTVPVGLEVLNEDYSDVVGADGTKGKEVLGLIEEKTYLQTTYYDGTGYQNNGYLNQGQWNATERLIGGEVKVWIAGHGWVSKREAGLLENRPTKSKKKEREEVAVDITQEVKMLVEASNTMIPEVDITKVLHSVAKKWVAAGVPSAKKMLKVSRLLSDIGRCATNMIESAENNMDSCQGMESYVWGTVSLVWDSLIAALGIGLGTGEVDTKVKNTGKEPEKAGK